MRPVLCQPIDFDTLLKLLNDDRWSWTQKCDGTRLLVSVQAGRVRGYSRRGEGTNVPKAIHDALSHSLPEGHFIFDGELLNSVFYVFDLVQAGQLVTAATPYNLRLTTLQHIAQLSQWQSPLNVLRTASSLQEKHNLLEEIIENNAEGVVARRFDASYEEGQRSRNVVKWKNRHTIDCVIREGEPGKEHFNLVLFEEDGREVGVGAVSALTGDGPKLKINDVVEVGYMGVSKDGRLIQPVTPKLRTDKSPSECTISQMVFVNKEVLL